MMGRALSVGLAVGAAFAVTLQGPIPTAAAEPVSTPVHRGDAGAPVIDFPIPAGWVDAGPATPPDAWLAITSTDVAFLADPARATFSVDRLAGTVDEDAVFDQAPNELRRLPGYQEMSSGQRTNLSGFPAMQFGGSYLKDGAPHVIAQKTVLIPARDGSGTFRLDIVAEGNEEQFVPLADLTNAIDDTTRITP
jgi:hypothetical protein